MKKLNGKNRKWLIPLGIVTILLVLCSLYLIINVIKLSNIENNLRLLGCIIITIFSLLYLTICYKRLYNYKLWKNVVLLVVGIIYIGIAGFLNYNFQVIYSKINDVTDNYKTSTLCLVTMKTNKIDDIKDIAAGKIGVINDTKVSNGLTLANKIMKEEKLDNTLKKYDEYLYIIKALYDGDIKYAFLPETYGSMFSMYDEYKDVDQKTKIIYTREEKTEVSSGTKSIDEPFTMLLMGVDNLQSSYNADTLLVVTFNPKTLSSTILSIPRDTYTTIACSGGKHKINSSGWYGDQCVVDTVAKYLDVDIDYYAKINFTGIVELVDALDGVEVDVPYKFCEQNSKRQFGNNTIYLNKGLQTLNGEQALALSRNRHGWSYCADEWNEDGVRNDFVRGQNQQLVLKALLNKVKSIRNIDTLYDLLNTIGNNIDTNMDKNTILSFYNIAKDVMIKSKDVPFEEIINMQRLFFTSYTPTVRLSGLPLSMVVNYDSSLKAIQKAMKQNLGLIKKSANLSYDFDINNPYVETVIGKDSYEGDKIETLPEFTGRNYQEISDYANSKGLNLTIEYREITDGSYSDGMVISQTPLSYTDLASINKSKGITIVVAQVESSNVSSRDYSKCKDEKNKEKQLCLIPTFDTYTSYKNWIKEVRADGLSVKVNEVQQTDDPTKHDLVVNQEFPVNNLYDLWKDGKTLTIKYYDVEKQPEKQPENTTVED